MAPREIEHEITLRFYGPLDQIRSRRTVTPEYTVPLPLRRSVKDLIEAEGVPHTEVGMVLVNGSPQGIDTVLQGGERLSVYPAMTRLVEAAQSGGAPALIADVHLGKLARRLRLLGLDCAYRNTFDDQEIAERSALERRMVLTRDRGLLMRGQVTMGILILSHRTDEQVRQVIERLSPLYGLRPASRCLDCNGLLQAVPKGSAQNLLPPRTRSYVSACFRCGDCGKAFWKGAHWKAIEAWVHQTLEHIDTLRAWDEKSLPSGLTADVDTQG